MPQRMNFLHSFVACMSPDQVSPNNSIESINREDYKFLATNIDEQGNDISRGELHVTDDAIIYMITNKTPISWPLYCIRRYGCIDNGQKLIFEAGRKCGTGQGQSTPQKPLSTRVRQRRDASTSTSTHTDSQLTQSSIEVIMNNTVKPLSYVLIDFETTKALNDSAQAHAATRFIIQKSAR